LIFCFSFEAYSQRLNSDEQGGYLKITILDQDSAHVVINEDFDAVLKIASGDTLSLETGVAKVRVIKEYYKDMVRTTEVEGGDIKRLLVRLSPIRGNKEMSRRSSYPRLFWEANNFILSDPETDLYINGSLAGRQYTVVDTVGTFEVRGVHESGREFTTTFRAGPEAPFHFHGEFVKPSAKSARLLSMVPGGSQLYKKQTLKGIAFSVVTLGGAALAYSYESRYQDEVSEFNRLNSLYISANNPEEAFRLGNEAEKAHEKSVSLSQYRNRVLYGTALVYLANIVDGFIAPPIGYRDESRTINPYLDFDPAFKQPVIGIKSSF
jgi:hypothetical protein